MIMMIMIGTVSLFVVSLFEGAVEGSEAFVQN
jgi:hypothetical protein